LYILGYQSGNSKLSWWTKWTIWFKQK